MKTKVLIVGLGLIGGSYGAKLKEVGYEVGAITLNQEDIDYAIENNIGHIVIDDFLEIERINKIAGEMGKKVTVMLRIKPGIDAHTHDFIKTGQNDCKFGFSLETGEAFEAAEKAIKAAATPQPEAPAKKRKLTYKEQKELEQIEKDLESLAAEKQELEDALSSGTLPFDKLQVASERIGQIMELTDEKEMRWLELTDI